MSARPHTAPALSAQALQDFLHKASLLGHDAARLMDGQEEVRFFTVPTLEEARHVMCNATAEQRSLRASRFFNEVLMARTRLGQGMHDRGECVVFAEGTSSPADQRGLAHHLPGHVKALSVLHKVLQPGEEWDVSVRAEVWGISPNEELYCAVNVGTLVVHPGARLVIRGNVFSLLVQRLVILPGHGTEAFQIGILPTPYPVDVGRGPLHGLNGENGRHGHTGWDAPDPLTEPTWLGPVLCGSPVPCAGGDGGPGAQGQDGGHGRNGGPCKLAEITLRQLDGHLTVLGQPGHGGKGGDGGLGGDGGDGGRGSAGYEGLSGSLPAGHGGSAGSGGNGGRGGNGGNGGLSSNVYVCLPEHQEPLVSLVMRPSLGGMAGHGGLPGKGGRAGGPGIGPAPTGDAPQQGNPGIPGREGLQGRQRPAPVAYLNEARWPPLHPQHDLTQPH